MEYCFFIVLFFNLHHVLSAIAFMSFFFLSYRVGNLKQRTFDLSQVSSPYQGVFKSGLSIYNALMFLAHSWIILKEAN